MPFASALSEHPVTAYATGEVCGQVLEAIGAHPDLALVFVTLAHAGALEDVAAAVREVLHPSVLLGAASVSVVGTGREVEGGPGISLWAGRWGPVVPVRVPEDDPRIAAGPDHRALILLGDPYSAPIDDILSLCPVAVVGGMASGARGRGGTRLALDGTVFTDGAVGALIGPGLDMTTLVSQGCRPIGRPYVVTEGGGRMIRQLGGQPALERLEALGRALSPEDVRSINGGALHLGRVIDERKVDFGPGDFLVRPVLGGDPSSGAIAVNDDIEVGTTVQFHLRDAAAAHEELERMLADAGSDEYEAALLFTCNGRGRALFGVPDHDAGMLSDSAGPLPTAGFFAAGELGPVAGHNEIHSFTASVVFLREHLGMVTR